MSYGSSNPQAYDENFLRILHGPIFFNFNFLLWEIFISLNVPIINNQIQKCTSLFLIFDDCLYLVLLPCSYSLTYTCHVCIVVVKSSASALLIFVFSKISYFINPSWMDAIKIMEQTQTCTLTGRIIVCKLNLCKCLVPWFWMVTNEAS